MEKKFFYTNQNNLSHEDEDPSPRAQPSQINLNPFLPIVERISTSTQLPPVRELNSNPGPSNDSADDNTHVVERLAEQYHKFLVNYEDNFPVAPADSAVRLAAGAGQAIGHYVHLFRDQGPTSPLTQISMGLSVNYLELLRQHIYFEQMGIPLSTQELVNLTAYNREHQEEIRREVHEQQNTFSIRRQDNFTQTRLTSGFQALYQVRTCDITEQRLDPFGAAHELTESNEWTLTLHHEATEYRDPFTIDCQAIGDTLTEESPKVDATEVQLQQTFVEKANELMSFPSPNADAPDMPHTKLETDSKPMLQSQNEAPQDILMDEEQQSAPSRDQPYVPQIRRVVSESSLEKLKADSDAVTTVYCNCECCLNSPEYMRRQKKRKMAAAAAGQALATQAAQAAAATARALAAQAAKAAKAAAEAAEAAELAKYEHAMSLHGPKDKCHRSHSRTDPGKKEGRKKHSKPQDCASGMDDSSINDTTANARCDKCGFHSQLRDIQMSPNPKEELLSTCSWKRSPDVCTSTNTHSDSLCVCNMPDEDLSELERLGSTDTLNDVWCNHQEYLQAADEWSHKAAIAEKERRRSKQIGLKQALRDMVAKKDTKQVSRLDRWNRGRELALRLVNLRESQNISRRNYYNKIRDTLRIAEPDLAKLHWLATKMWECPMRRSGCPRLCNDTIMAHFLTKHMSGSILALTEVNSRDRILIVFKPLWFKLSRNFCLSILAFGSTSDSKYRTYTCNADMPNGYRRFNSHIPILIMGCRVRDVDMQGMTVPYNSDATDSYADNDGNFGNMIIWAVTINIPQIMHAHLTVFNQRLEVARSANMKVRTLHRSQDARKFIHKSNNCMRLTDQEIRRLTHDYSEPLHLEVSIWEFDENVYSQQ